VAETRWLRFHWTPDRQEIAVDGETFAHPEAVGTAPSHDLAHLLAAASGLPWKPKGTRDDVCRAEFAAVLLEHLGVYVFDAVVLGRGSANSVLDRTLEHARWFAIEHYAPFPESFDSALDRLRVGVDAEVLVRLSPVFFRLRAFELEHGDFRQRTFGARFCSTFRPEVDVDGSSRQPQRELACQVERLLNKPLSSRSRGLR